MAEIKQQKCPNCGNPKHIYVNKQITKIIYRCLRCQYEWIEEKK